MSSDDFSAKKSKKAPKAAASKKTVDAENKSKKAKGSHTKTAEQMVTEDESRAIKKQARSLGIISSSPSCEDKEYCKLNRSKPSQQIRKHSSKKPLEIFKRANVRKNKVLFVFPGLVSVVQEGKFGQLSNMDTNPTLDIEFPQGTLRLTGTHVHSKQKYVTMLPKAKKVLAQDTFDHFVVFGGRKWLGDPSSDPTKQSSDSSALLHKDFSFDGGAGSAESSTAPLSKPSIPSANQTGNQTSIASFFDSSQGDSTRVRRAAASKGVKYSEKGSDDDDSNLVDDDDDDDDDDDANSGTRSPVKLPIPALPQIPTPTRTSTSEPRRKSSSAQPKSDTIVLDDSDDDEDSQPSQPSQKTTAQKTPKKSAGTANKQPASAKKSTPASATKTKRKAKDDDDDEDDDEYDDEDDYQAKRKPTPKKASNTPKRTPKKSTKKKKSSDDEESSEEEAVNISIRILEVMTLNVAGIQR
ncbi:hypothetical protein GUITHDRAFT_109079 [Guillardia theta CCMP2712]|uniref:Uncharacterized protein n=1 Tax=Guillardia theta (strain CCMP2712) TaxID=905079 RepID=L1JAA9_GUITC|nr:hypothetical protein GUITHDRAFT_109079 [Guillardia theta CCMP2712]EKX45034.1 hypothetical protein GUITHDRAFT_109079 [Guillardia theta CCMP2712]|eukprot:XP_005832014.1 hypothetical protein GUITHDRAFT_109079 [Guillardia theta CCMP2712]